MTHQHSTDEGGAGLVRDRVSQVYLGMLDWGATGARLRRRIDWMADEARGPRILDVGCSEGILEVLLARRGLEVTGVDINADALDFARGLLAEEPDEVRERVELVHGTAEETGLSPGSFDTVVLGETLEHVHDPAALLDESLRPLREGGQVVITTPFGYHPHEDHHQTFCLSDFIALMRPRCALDTLYIEEGYIRFTGLLTPDRDASWADLDGEAVTGMTEEAFLKSQTGLYGRIESQRSRAEQQHKRIREVLDRAMKLQDRIQDLQRQVEFDRMAVARLKANLESRTGEVRVLRHRLQATRSSTSFLAGSAMVRAAKQPHTLWKLPFQLLRLYRSASKPPAEAVTSTESGATHSEYFDLLEEPGLDASKFIKYPPLPVPEAKVNGPPVAAILDTFTEHSFRYEADLLLLSRRNWRSGDRGEAAGITARRVGVPGQQRRMAVPDPRQREPGGQSAARAAGVLPLGREFRPYSGIRRTRRTSTISSARPESSTSSLRRTRTAFRYTGRPWGMTGYTSCPSRHSHGCRIRRVRKVGASTRCALPGAGCSTGTPSAPSRSGPCWTRPSRSACTYSTATWLG